jgi:Tfp pilus assembly protein PilO
MNPIKLVIAEIGKEKTKYYTSLAFFLIIFSVFVVFAIRPALTTAFAIKENLVTLTALDLQYEKVISYVSTTQANLERLSAKLDVLPQAVPSKPSINRLIADIEDSASQSGVILSKIAGGNVDLVGKKGALNAAVITVESTASLKNLRLFQKSLFNQRRLKAIKKLDIVKEDSNSTTEGELKILMEITGYYL